MEHLPKVEVLNALRADVGNTDFAAILLAAHGEITRLGNELQHLYELSQAALRNYEDDAVGYVEGLFDAAQNYAERKSL